MKSTHKSNDGDGDGKEDDYVTLYMLYCVRMDVCKCYTTNQLHGFPYTYLDKIRQKSIEPNHKTSTPLQFQS